MQQIKKNSEAKITELHNEIIENFKNSLQKGIQIGGLLAEQKEKLKHGQWMPWVKNNLPFSARMAQNYMRLYDNQDKVLEAESIKDAQKMLTEQNAQRVSHLDALNHLDAMFSFTSLPNKGDVIHLVNYSPLDNHCDIELLEIKWSECNPEYLNPSVRRLNTATDYGYEIYNKRGGVKINTLSELISFYGKYYNFKATADLEKQQ